MPRPNLRRYTCSIAVRFVIGSSLLLSMLLLGLAQHETATAGAETQMGTISLTVRDYQGRPVPHAYLSITINLDIIQHEWTDDKGGFSFQVGANSPTSLICADTGSTSLPYFSSACVDHLVVAAGATLAVDLVLPPPPATPRPQPPGSAPAPTATPSSATPAPALTATSVPASVSTPCQFVLGFKALHDLLSAVVGDCLDNERHSPQNGDGLQHTAKGLLVWRKADNVAAFTDGYHTWVNGPQGVRERLNIQRFAWEANPDGRPVVP